MSFNITTAFKNTYNQNVEHLSQQRESRLRGSVRIVSGLLGEKHFIDQLGKRDPVAINNRHGDSPLNSQAHDRRMLTLTDYEDGDLVDKPDIIRTLDDPANQYVQSMAMGFGRQYDRIVITAATGTSYSGKTGTTSNSLASANKVAVDYVESGSAANSNLTVGKLRRASAIMNAFELGDERFIAVSASQIHSLLQDSEVTSQDFNTVRALVNGEINTYMGFQFIRTELLTLNSSTDVRTCFAWVRDGIVLGEGQGFMSRIQERPDKRFNTYVYTKATLGAVRMEEEKVVEISCDQSP